MLTLYAYSNLEFTYYGLFPLQTTSLDVVIFSSPISVLILNPRIRCHFFKRQVKRSVSIPSHISRESIRPNRM